MRAALAGAAGRSPAAEANARADRDARRAALLAHHGSAWAALTPCPRERDLAEAVWRLVIPGSPETGPSLAGWRGAPGEALPPEVLAAVSRVVPAPATAEAGWAEHRHWAERAAAHDLLDGPGLPLWVRARRAFLETHLDTLFVMLPADPEAHAAWRRLAEGAGETSPASDARPAPPVPAGQDTASPADPEPPQAGPPRARADTPPAPSASPRAPEPEPEPVQTGQPKRTRKEAQAAVRALLGEPLTDREIARRVGVSPTTVAAVRRSAA